MKTKYYAIRIDGTKILFANRQIKLLWTEANPSLGIQFWNGKTEYWPS